MMENFIPLTKSMLADKHHGELPNYSDLACITADARKDETATKSNKKNQIFITLAILLQTV